MAFKVRISQKFNTLLKEYEEVLEVKLICEYCRTSFWSTRNDQKTCSDRCRQAKYRANIKLGKFKRY